MNRHSVATSSVLLTILLAGCGGAEDGNQAAPVSSPQEQAPAQEQELSAAVEERALVATAETEFGTILVDGRGFTLYALSTDLLNTPSCYGDCKEDWPPLLTVGEPQAGKEIDSTNLGVATRHDGTYQVSYDGKPLYMYQGDTFPGDTLGHGSGDVWFVLAPFSEPASATGEEGGSQPTEGEYNPDDYY